MERIKYIKRCINSGEMSSFKELIAVVYNPRQVGEIIKVCNL